MSTPRARPCVRERRQGEPLRVRRRLFAEEKNAPDTAVSSRQTSAGNAPVDGQGPQSKQGLQEDVAAVGSDACRGLTEKSQ